MTSELPGTLNCQKYPLYTEYLPMRDTFSRFVKIKNAPKDIRLTLNT